MSDIELLKAQNERLQAEALALQAILSQLMLALRRAETLTRFELTKVFDHAAKVCADAAGGRGRKTAPAQAGAVRIVESLRNQFTSAE